MKRNLILISAVLPCIFLPGEVWASIVVTAQGGATPGTFVGPTRIDTVGTQAATSRLSAFPAIGTSFLNEGFSSTTFGDTKCLFCGQSMDARATADGSGQVKLFTGVGMIPNTQGIALVSVDLQDTLQVSSPLTISLDTFFSLFDRGPTLPFLAPYGTHATFQMGLTISDVNNAANFYSVQIDSAKSYQNGFTHVDTEFWRIQEDVGAGWTTLAGTSLIADANGHFGASRLVNLSSGSWDLSFFATSESFCSGGSPMTCNSAFDSWSTSYLGIQGSFTSQNGYQYTGLAAPSTQTPEPGMFFPLCSLAGAVLLLRVRVRAREAMAAAAKPAATSSADAGSGTPV